MFIGLYFWFLCVPCNLLLQFRHLKKNSHLILCRLAVYGRGPSLISPWHTASKSSFFPENVSTQDLGMCFFVSFPVYIITLKFFLIFLKVSVLLPLGILVILCMLFLDPPTPCVLLQFSIVKASTIAFICFQSDIQTVPLFPSKSGKTETSSLLGKVAHDYNPSGSGG